MEQHIKRAIYESDHVCNQCIISLPVKTAIKWGWKPTGNRWTRYLTTPPEAVKSCYELVQFAVTAVNVFCSSVVPRAAPEFHILYQYEGSCSDRV